MKVSKLVLTGALLLAASVALAACSTPALAPAPAPSESGSTSDLSGDSSGDPSGNLSGELTIFAAASLTASFTELAKDFTAKYPDVTINPISFDGSSTLAAQISEGAPVDVFASANIANIEKVKSLINGPSSLFASNVLQIAVQPGNPLRITGLADLTKPGVQAVLCAPAVPCGTASHTLLNLDGVKLTPVSEEQNVKAVLTKVQLGEADAGLVYATDVKAAGGAVDGVDIAGADFALNAYPIASLAASKNPEAAKAFVDFVISPEGQAVLAKFGFSAP